MSGYALDASLADTMVEEARKETFTLPKSPRSPLSRPRSPLSGCGSVMTMDGGVDTTIDQLYRNVCEMQSSDESPSRTTSFLSYGEESRLDSELCHLAGYIPNMEITKEVVSDSKAGFSGTQSSPALLKVSMKKNVSQQSPDVTPRSKLIGSHRLQIDKNNAKKTSGVFSTKKQRNLAILGAKFRKGLEEILSVELDNPELGPFLLKKAIEMISSGENPQKILQLLLRARDSFEQCSKGKPNLELVMCLHVLATVYCKLGNHKEAIPVLERSIEIPVLEYGQDHALAKFAGCMQLGDSYAMMGQIENSILFYTAGLETQRQVLGELDVRFCETCRYVAEAHVQALQFDEAERLCKMALDVHKEQGASASIEEAADRRLMGLIYEAKGEHESALEHYVLAGMLLSANDQELEVALIDCSIGDAYLALARYDEAIFSYQKGLTVLKSAKGESHPHIASVYVRLADLHNRIGKFKESKSYCENAFRIIEKASPQTPSEEVATVLMDLAVIYQSMNNLEQAVKLLKRASELYSDVPSQQSSVAGIESQIGVLYYMMGNYSASYDTLKSATDKFYQTGENKSGLYGIVLNQMGLNCVQRNEINEAADLFEEAKSTLEKEYGPSHPDTLGVYSNLAGIYDAMDRLDDAIEILDYVIGMREEKLGTAYPDMFDERRRLSVLQKEAGKGRSKKLRPLVTLLDAHSWLEECAEAM